MKKVLSILLSLSILVSSMAISTVALAGDSVKVEYSVSADGKFMLEPTTLTVTADLSDKYGYEDSCEGVSILDATIAAHIKMYGEDFNKKVDFAISKGYSFDSSFGKNTTALGYRVNGVSAFTYSDEIKSKDYVEYMFYQDAALWTDAYTLFNSRAKAVNAGESVTLNLKAEGYDASWNPVISNANGVTITVDGKEYGKTDKNGNIKIKINQKGDHVVSATGKFGDAFIFAPYCKVTVNNHLSDYVEKTNASAMQFLMANVKSLNVDNAMDYLTYLDSGYDMSAYKSAFLKSVKSNLEKNNGKLLNMNGDEDLGLYGAVIQILNRYGMNTKNAYGYNLNEAFEALPANKISNPYLYRVAIMSASEKFAKKLCDQFIKDYYTMGKGMNYWGYSCDNTAVFLTAISPCASEFKSVVDDAKKVIASYTTDKGCYYSAEYTNENPDSTAVALMAYSAIGDNKKAMELYKALKTFESDTLGVMLAYGDKNEYATKEAVLALEYLNNSINNAGFDAHLTRTVVSKKATTSANGLLKDKCYACGKTISSKPISKIKSATLSKTAYTYTGKAIKPSVTLMNANGKKISSKYYTVEYKNNTKIGTATATIKLKGRYSGTITKTFKINPTKPTGVKVTAGKKAFTVKVKADKATGYQIEYTKSKKVNKITTKYTSKTVKNLKKGKYTVRVRAYKTVNNKKYYSHWSKAKTVTVK